MSGSVSTSRVSSRLSRMSSSEIVLCLKQIMNKYFSHQAQFQAVEILCNNDYKQEVEEFWTWSDRPPLCNCSLQVKSTLKSHILVVYYTMTSSTITYAKRINLPVPQILFHQFKEWFFDRKSSFRFFIKTICEELQEMVNIEVNSFSEILPMYKGCVVFHVEKG